VLPSLDAALRAELLSLDAQHRTRSCPAVAGQSRAALTVDAEPLISFSSNDYLGLAGHPALASAAAAAIARSGFGASASRLVSGDLPEHRELEAALSTFLGVDAVLLFPSGYQTNLGVLPALAGPGDLVLCDHANHASTIDACRLSRARLSFYRHLDVSSAEKRLLALAQTWSADSRQPLITATQHYVRFLMNQPDRVGDVPAAIEQYRSVLTDANGPDSASLAEPVRFGIELALSLSQWQVAEASAWELLELQESLTGKTSEAYLGDLQTAANVYEATDRLRALPLRRQVVAIADLAAAPNNDWRRAQTRMDLALAEAYLEQFDEAVTQAEEAVALQRTMRSPGTNLSQQLEQIIQMKQAAIPVA